MRAVTGFAELPKDATDLKKLALFFNHIYCISPHLTIIKEEMVEQFLGKWRQGTPTEIDYFAETRSAVWLPLRSIGGETEELVDEFENRGILTEIQQEQTQDIADPVYDELRRVLLQSDLIDKEFLRISETPALPARGFPVDLKVLTLELLDRKNGSPTKDLYWIAEPNAAVDSQHITRILYQAGLTSSSPVFLSRRNQAELRHRYAQYFKGLEAVSKVIPEFLVESDMRWGFGESILAITNTAFNSRLIAEKSPKDILRYRDAMEDARVQYVTHDLMEISAMMEGSPWSDQSRVQLQNYISRKLSSDLVSYDQKSKEIWEKLFGDTVVEMVDVAKSVTMGAGVGSLVGNLFPNVAALHLLLVGAAVAVAKDSPKIARTLVDAFIECRKLKRSSIAYVAEFR